MSRQAEPGQTGAIPHGPTGHGLKARKLGLIAGSAEPIAVMPEDCAICRAEGLTARTSILVEAGDRQIVARLMRSTNDLVAEGEIGLSDEAWNSLGLSGGEGSVAKIVKLEHAWRRLDGRNDDGFQVAPFPG